MRGQSRNARRSTDEIEVTAEMVAAGMRAISGAGDYDEMVARIYRAMEHARRCRAARQAGAAGDHR
jgi:hypothetical protein